MYFTLAYPYVLWALLALPLLVVWYWYNEKKKAYLGMATLEGVSKQKFSLANLFIHIPFTCRIIALGLLLLVAARPQQKQGLVENNLQGIDIMLTIDVSHSMLTQDFQPNRLEVAKEVAQEFVQGRMNDKLGYTIFSGEAFTECPLTTSKDVVIDMIKETQVGFLEQGTAIGVGLATAVNRIKKSDGKSKVIILLSDGENNAGEIGPITAAEIAKTFDIKVYTIGMGSRGEAMTPTGTDANGNYIFSQGLAEVDEGTMQKIAEITGGKYFAATDKQALKEVYKEIDRLEKNDYEQFDFQPDPEELYLPFALIALLLLMVEQILKYTLFRTIESR